MKNPFKNLISEYGEEVSGKVKEDLRLLYCLMSSYNPLPKSKEYVFDHDLTLPNYSTSHNNEVIKVREIYSLLEKYPECESSWKKIWWEHRKEKKSYEKMPKIDSRDNKNALVLTGGGGSNKVRYPSKKRSRSTWARFYKLFPRLAEVEQWDGKTSTKYDGKL